MKNEKVELVFKKIIELLYENKCIILEPNKNRPYILKIELLNEDFEEELLDTKYSPYLIEERNDLSLKKYCEYLINDILSIKENTNQEKITSIENFDKYYERLELTLKKMINLLYEKKRIIIEPDWDMPYTLIIQDLDENGKIISSEHTHSSYFFEEKTDIAIQKYIESLSNDFIGDSNGLSWGKE